MKKREPRLEAASSRAARPTSKPNAIPLEHFASSGLTAEIIQALRIAFVAAGSDPSIWPPVPSARIPYFDLDGNPIDFFRTRLLKEFKQRDGKLLRHVQAKGAANHLYLPLVGPRSWRDIGEDVSTPMSPALFAYYRIRGGGPRYSKLGRLVRYRRAALEEWLLARERDSTSDTGDAA